MQVRRFTDRGMQEFERYLRALKDDPSLSLPMSLLDDPQTSEPTAGAADVESRVFSSKYEAGQYLVERLAPLPDLQLRRDAELWAWLTLFYFEGVCPVDGHGRRQRKDLAHYLPQKSDHRLGLNKHFLYFPWRLVRLHSEKARYILESDLSVDSKITREFSKRIYQALIPVVIDLGRRLYWDDQGNRVRVGATSTGDRRRLGRPGNLRRFLDLLYQFELTYDLYGLDSRSVMHLLPQREFARWLS